MSQGKKLISEIAENTGLPENLMVAELGKLISGAGLNADVVSLDDLRRVLADYAQEVLLSAKASADEEAAQPKPAAG